MIDKSFNDTCTCLQLLHNFHPPPPPKKKVDTSQGTTLSAFQLVTRLRAFGPCIHLLPTSEVVAIVVIVVVVVVVVATVALVTGALPLNNAHLLSFANASHAVTTDSKELLSPKSHHPDHAMNTNCVCVFSTT